MGRVVTKGPSERDRGDNEIGDAEHGTESVKVAVKGELVPGGGDRVGCGERGESVPAAVTMSAPGRFGRHDSR